jgi:hypothetical protein
MSRIKQADLHRLLKTYNNDEISIGKMVEKLNTIANRFTSIDVEPEFSGWYLCIIEKKEECGAVNKYYELVFNAENFETDSKIIEYKHLPAL